MKKITFKDYISATKAIFLFKRYTNYSRFTEISFGILSWMSLIIVSYSFYLMIL